MAFFSKNECKNFYVHTSVICSISTFFLGGNVLLNFLFDVNIVVNYLFTIEVFLVQKLNLTELEKFSQNLLLLAQALNGFVKLNFCTNTYGTVHATVYTKCIVGR